MRINGSIKNYFLLVGFVLFFLTFAPANNYNKVGAVTCQAGTADCDNSEANGCETNVNTDNNNCGSCGNKCNGFCDNGQCVKVTGGIVPCGRISDNCTTPIDERASCDLCSFFYMTKNVVNYVLLMVIAVAVLILVIAGVLFVFSGENPGNAASAKSAVTAAVIGLVIIFSGWLLVALFLQLIGYNNAATWNQVNCNVPNTTQHCVCGDGILDEELGELCDGPTRPENSSPSNQYVCAADCKSSSGGYCGDGIKNGPEVCDKADLTPHPCTGSFTAGIPSYCSGIPLEGTQTCNNTCTGWNDCVIGQPDLIEDQYGYGDCTNAPLQLNDYACCDLTDCISDGPSCCNGAQPAASVPNGYTAKETIDCSDCLNQNANCILVQSNSNERNWATAVNHTTASFRCWK